MLFETLPDDLPPARSIGSFFWSRERSARGPVITPVTTTFLPAHGPGPPSPSTPVPFRAGGVAPGSVTESPAAASRSICSANSASSGSSASSASSATTIGAFSAPIPSTRCIASAPRL